MKKHNILNKLRELQKRFSHDESSDDLSDTEERCIQPLKAFQRKITELEKLYSTKHLTDEQYTQDLNRIENCLRKLNNVSSFYDDEIAYNEDLTEIYEELLVLNINK